MYDENKAKQSVTRRVGNSPGTFPHRLLFSVREKFLDSADASATSHSFASLFINKGRRWGGGSAKQNRERKKKGVGRALIKQARKALVNTRRKRHQSTELKWKSLNNLNKRWKDAETFFVYMGDGERRKNEFPSKKRATLYHFIRRDVGKAPTNARIKSVRKISHNGASWVSVNVESGEDGKNTLKRKQRKFSLIFSLATMFFLPSRGHPPKTCIYVSYFYVSFASSYTSSNGRCDKSGVCFLFGKGKRAEQPTWTNSNKARVVGHPNKISWIISSDNIHETLSTVEDKQKGKIFMPRWDDVCANSWRQKADLEPVFFYCVLFAPNRSLARSPAPHWVQIVLKAFVLFRNSYGLVCLLCTRTKNTISL